MVISGLELYSDQESMIQTANNKIEVALGQRDGEIKFNHVFIDLERICNLACRGCFRFLDRDETRIKLSYQEIVKIIKFSIKRGTRVIVIAGEGEPTLDTDFRKIVEYIQSSGLPSVVFTNGITMDEELADFFFENSISPIVKRLSIDDEKQDYLIGRAGMSTCMQKGLEALMRIKDEREGRGKPTSEIAIECFITKENLTDIPDVLRYCRENGLIPYIETFITIGQKPTGPLLIPSQDEINNLFLELARIDEEEYGIVTFLKKGSRIYGGEPCLKAKAGFAVRINGDVLECVSGRYVFGNIKETSLESIFALQNSRISGFYTSMECTGCRCSASYGECV